MLRRKYVQWLCVYQSIVVLALHRHHSRKLVLLSFSLASL